MAVGLASAGETRKGLGSVASDDQPFSQFLLRPPLLFLLSLKLQRNCSRVALLTHIPQMLLYFNTFVSSLFFLPPGPFENELQTPCPGVKGGPSCGRWHRDSQLAPRVQMLLSMTLWSRFPAGVRQSLQ